MTHIKRASLADLRELHVQEALTPAAAQDDQGDLPVGFWDDAVVEVPKAKKAISLRVDPDVLDFFKSQGPGHLTRMHSVLRAYVDAKSAKRGG